jgi:hypothetical protein
MFYHTEYLTIMFHFICLLAQESAVLKVHCDSEKSKHMLKLLNQEHANPVSFAGYSQHLILAAKGW